MPIIDWFMRLRVTVHLKSGAKIRFLCTKINVVRNTRNELTEIKVENTKGWPLYTRLDDISAIQAEHVSRWASYR